MTKYVPFAEEQNKPKKRKSHVVSEETRKKMSLAKKGKKKAPFSDEWRLHMSQGKMGKKRKKFTEEHIKHLSQCKTGMLWWNNGTINKRAKECPGVGWVRGQIRGIK